MNITSNHKSRLETFLKVIAPKIREYPSIRITSAQKKQIEEMTIAALGVKDLFKLRDKFEGNAFHQKFELAVFGVLAIEKLLGVQYYDWDQVDPKTFVPRITINGIDIDIITFNFGELPIITLDPKNPIIFNILNNKSTIYTCGIALTHVLKSNVEQMTSHFVNNEERGFFYRFEELVSVSSENQISDLLETKMA